MADNDNINESIDENEETEEIGFEDSENSPSLDSEIEESEHATTDIPPADLIDLISNQKASEARAEIFRALYNKVGEKIEDMKLGIRKDE